MAGFTILELMIAATVFSVILLVVAVGVIGFTNSYYKGITASKTQANARAIMAAVTQSLQFGKAFNTPTSGSVRGFCIDNTLYAFVPGQQVTDSNPNAGKHQGYHGLVEQTGNDCSASIPAAVATPLGSPGSANLPSDARELLGPHVRINTFTISQSGDIFTVHLRLIYADDEVLKPNVTAGTNWDTATEQCIANQIGGRFCAASDLTTTVERRLL